CVCEVPHPRGAPFILASTVLALIGIGLAAAFYNGGYKAPAVRFGESFPGFVRLVQDKFRIDELYDRTIIRPIRAFSRGLYAFVDRVIVDKILVEGTAVVVDVFSRIARAVQGGAGPRYMAVFAVGGALFVHHA